MATANGSRKPDSDTELAKSQSLNDALNTQVQQLKDQVKTLQSENQTKDQVIQALEKELESVLQIKATLHPNVSSPSKASSIKAAGADTDKKTELECDATAKKGTHKSRGIIGIVGANQMGVHCAALLCMKQYKIILMDQNQSQLDRAKKLHQQIYDSYVAQNLISKEQAKHCQAAGMVYASSMTELSKYTDTMHTVIDVSHDMFKQQVLQNIAKCVNHKCMIVTHSNQKCVTEIQACLTKLAPSKRINVIGINLLWLQLSLTATKSIEIMPSWNTAPAIIQKCTALVVNDLGKHCVVVSDQCGFISNRLLAVYVNEAFQMLQCKVASSKDIDQMQASMNEVSNGMGPFALADRVGLDVIKQILDELYAEYGEHKYVANCMLKQYIRAGKFGRKTKVGVYSYQKPTTSAPQTTANKAIQK
mmetsp:Transcript_38546/g.63176  ORF Transcript_38546/g.63176 Transcript_38546/m.63176 type:complete len:420 (+) Transcript_38546:49-1308(+)